MLTIFSTPKPFRGHIGMIQRNAIESWKRLHPDVEVILFGDDEGAASVARELGIKHESYVERHESGLKYVGYLFQRAQTIASHNILCYSNCDMILLGDFLEAVKATAAWRKRFLLASQRWDTDVAKPVDFDSRDWETVLHDLVTRTGSRQMRAYVDYFVFPRGLYESFPPLVIGRWYWDWWLVWKALSCGATLVDCTPFVTAIHQNHDYAYHPQGWQGTAKDVLARRNFQLAGNGQNLSNLEDAKYELTRSGRFRRTWLRRERSCAEKFAKDLVVGTWYSMLKDTYDTRRFIGLNRERIGQVLTKLGVGRTSR